MPQQISRMFHLPNWSMKRIYPEEQKVQPAHSFYSATGLILLKRKPLTSTTMFLFRSIKAPLQTAGGKNVLKKALLKHCQRNNTNCYTQLCLVVWMTGSSFPAHKTMSHFWGPENLTLEHEASRCIVKCCKQYTLTASAAQIPTTRSSDCAFPAAICDWQRPPSGRPRYLAIWYLPYLSGEANKRAVNISLPLSPHAVNQTYNYMLCCVRERGAELIQ